MTSEFQLFIDRVSREGSAGETVDVVNPATGLVFGKIAYASLADIEATIRLAEEGLRSWSAVPPWERAAS